MITQTHPIGIVVDATNLVTVNYKAGPGKVETGLFCRQLDFLEGRYSPSWMIAAFDSSESYRKEIDPEYKSNRGPKDPNLVESLKIARQAIADRGWIVAELPGFEADDILASCSKVIVDALNGKCVLVSRDKDINQLLRPGFVSIIKKVSIAKGDEHAEFYTAADCEKEHEIPPDLWIDYQMLIGDKGDNVIGVEGIGKKIAVRLLKATGSVDKLLRLPEVASTKRLVANLRKFESRADVVREMVTLRDTLPVAGFFR